MTLHIYRERNYIYREIMYIHTLHTYIERREGARDIIYRERLYIYIHTYTEREKGRERDYINLFKFIPDNKLSNFSLNFIFQELTNDNYINGYPTELV